MSLSLLSDPEDRQDEAITVDLCISSSSSTDFGVFVEPLSLDEISRKEKAREGDEGDERLRHRRSTDAHLLLLR